MSGMIAVYSKRPPVNPLQLDPRAPDSAFARKGKAIAATTAPVIALSRNMAPRPQVDCEHEAKSCGYSAENQCNDTQRKVCEQIEGRKYAAPPLRRRRGIDHF